METLDHYLSEKAKPLSLENGCQPSKSELKDLRTDRGGIVLIFHLPLTFLKKIGFGALLRYRIRKITSVLSHKEVRGYWLKESSLLEFLAKKKYPKSSTLTISPIVEYEKENPLYSDWCPSKN
jgi:hypothetical protein